MAAWKKILTSSEIATTVTNGNTSTVPSEDAVYDFVTGQGYTTNAGTVTSVSAGDGLTQTGTSTVNPTINVVGGDGITSSADEIEVTVDGVTIELSAADGSGAVKAKTAAVSNGGTALATGDQIYDFVTGLGYTTNAGTVTSVTAGDGLTQSGTSTVNPTINVVGGDGITANADEIEVSVDGVTIELSASDGSGTVRAKTAAIANAGTALATADQIHTFVTTQTDTMAAGTTGNAATASAVTTSSANTGDWKIALVTGTTSGDQESIKYDPAGLSWNSGTDTLTVGNLTVSGTTTTVNTTNLEVLDQFVLLNNAATATDADGGIVVEGSTKSVAFGYDQSADRWGFDKTGATSGMSALVVDAYAVSVHTGTDGVSQDSDFAMSGNIYVDTANGNAYIYA